MFNIWDKRRKQPFCYHDIKADKIIRIMPLFETEDDAVIWLKEFFKQEGKVEPPENLFELFGISEYV